MSDEANGTNGNGRKLELTAVVNNINATTHRIVVNGWTGSVFIIGVLVLVGLGILKKDDFAPFSAVLGPILGYLGYRETQDRIQFREKRETYAPLVQARANVELATAERVRAEQGAAQ